MKRLASGTNYVRCGLGEIEVIALRDGYIDSRECTACLKTAVSASRGHISNNVTTPFAIIQGS
ncbi:hypothetical protein HB780_00095 (plasmid) [Rhizobium lusitanum]|uniref:hypothetical protein n=1 Tax=Rhizobium lusitanum TaxID=293958 RepID=UPI00161D06AD|nr:hypothetical protein [Rhizobium lusitanum]QND44271.1 hypothetical protein HB780_00095 [Rhizobium lusitanum]